MHVAFYPYGEETAVNFLLEQMKCQKYQLPVFDPDRAADNCFLWVAGNVRRLPCGVIDYVFPAANLDIVLASLGLDKKYHYQDMKWIIEPVMMATRKAFRLKPIPKTFDASHTFVWIKEHVNIIPLGIREDIMEWIDPANGTVHEAL